MGLRVLAVSLGLLGCLLGCTETPVLVGVSAEDARRAVAALDQVEVPAHARPEDDPGDGARWRVTVPDRDVARAVGVLVTAAIPRQAQAGFTETWGSRTLASGPTEERAREAQAVAGELARTLSTLDGVVDARVHVALPPVAPLDAPAEPVHPTASVLRTFAGTSPRWDTPSVQRMVAGAVIGLAPRDVTVVGASRGVQPPRPALVRVGPFAVVRTSASALRGVLGVGAATIVALAAALVFAGFRRTRSGGGAAAP